MVRCGVCAGRVVYDPRSSQAGQNPLYRCYDRKCVSRTADLADDVVERLVIARLSRKGDALTTADVSATDMQSALDEARTLRERLAEMEEAAVAGKLSADAFGRIEARLDEQITQAEARAAATVPTPLPEVVATLSRGDVQAGSRRYPSKNDALSCGPCSSNRDSFASAAPTCQPMRSGWRSGGSRMERSR